MDFTEKIKIVYNSNMNMTDKHLSSTALFIQSQRTWGGGSDEDGCSGRSKRHRRGTGTLASLKKRLCYLCISVHMFSP